MAVARASGCGIDDCESRQNPLPKNWNVGLVVGDAVGGVVVGEAVTTEIEVSYDRGLAIKAECK
eukprot:scaffold66547_cov20-Cyclotella_meneghiniana.AAC.1